MISGTNRCSFSDKYTLTFNNSTMDVIEVDVTEQLEGVEAWEGGGWQLNSSGHAISVAFMQQCTLEHRVFAYDSLVKTGELIIETQRLFRCRFIGTFQVAIPS
jgi:hypothetical protein